METKIERKINFYENNINIDQVVVSYRYPISFLRVIKNIEMNSIQEFRDFKILREPDSIEDGITVLKAHVITPYEEDFGTLKFYLNEEQKVIFTSSATCSYEFLTSDGAKKFSILTMLEPLFEYGEFRMEFIKINNLIISIDSLDKNVMKEIAKEMLNIGYEENCYITVEGNNNPLLALDDWYDSSLIVSNVITQEPLCSIFNIKQLSIEKTNKIKHWYKLKDEEELWRREFNFNSNQIEEWLNDFKYKQDDDNHTLLFLLFNFEDAKTFLIEKALSVITSDYYETKLTTKNI